MISFILSGGMIGLAVLCIEMGWLLFLLDRNRKNIELFRDGL